MCLYYDKKATAEIRQRFKDKIKKTGDKNPYLTFWKIYKITRLGLEAPCQSVIADIDQNGVIASDRPSKSLSHDEKTYRKLLRNVRAMKNRYDKGIHVYYCRNRSHMALKNWNFSYGKDYTLISVHGRYKDFIAAGDDNDAVFMKVTIPKATRDRMNKRIQQKQIPQKIGQKL